MRSDTTTKRGVGSRADAATEQYVTFLLADEEYGIAILRVQEIRGWEPVTPIPKSPSYVRGVMNLRGVVVPIVDLRVRFDLESVEYGPTTVVIVVKVTTASGEHTVGLVIDAISEVYDVGEDERKARPEVVASIDTEFLKGIATVDGKLVILLDIDRLINDGLLNEVIAAA